ncbi:MAG: FliH/SctL family protein [Pseudomonadota bacterium]
MVGSSSKAFQALWETSDQHETADEAPSASPKDSFEKDVTAAREEAYQRGLEDGRNLAMKSIAAGEKEALMSISTAFDRLVSTQKNHLDRQAKAHAEVATEILSEVINLYSSQNAFQDLTRVIVEVAQQIDEHSSLFLRLAPNTHARLATRLHEAFSTQDIKIEITQDPSLTNGDCQLEWSGGRLKRSNADIRKRIEAAFARINLKSNDVQALSEAQKETNHV